MKQALDQVVSPFVADPEAMEAEQPREGPLDHPPVAAERLAGVDPRRARRGVMPRARKARPRAKAS